MWNWLQRHRTTIAWSVGSVAALVLYLSCTKSLWKHNPLFDSSAPKNYDQTFYLASARDFAMHTPGLMPRSRMPLYPWLLHFFCDPSKRDDELLNCYIRFNVGVSVVCLGGVFFILRRFLGTWFSVLLTLVTAFRVFIFKAVLVQPEILFYTLYFALFALLLRLLVKPTWRLAACAGLLAGITHLTKGSALPMIGLFLIASFALQLIVWWRTKNARALLAPLAFLVGFMAVAGVWLRNSAVEYGSPFYDPNTKHYFWAENPREMLALQHLGLASWKPRYDANDVDDDVVNEFLPKWAPDPAMRAELKQLAASGEVVILEGKYNILPSSARWWTGHTWFDAIVRVWQGFIAGTPADDPEMEKRKRLRQERERNPRRQLLYFPAVGAGDTLIGHNRDHPNGYWDFLRFLFGSALVTVSLALIFSHRAVFEAVRRHWVPLVFAITVIAITGLSYAWWGHISNRNRYFLTLWLPLMLTFGRLVRFSCSLLPVHLTFIWHRRTFQLNACSIFLLAYTLFTATDLNDPLNRGNLPKPEELQRQLVQ